MATRDKAAGSTTTIRTLSNTTAWVGGVVPIAGDDARWISTSSSGAHTGSITCDRIIVEGATGDITHSSGTVTFSSTGVFYQNVTDSARRFTVAGGTWALGGANRDCRLYTSVGNYTLQLFSANAITGTAASVINVINHLGTGLANNAYIVVGNTQSGFVGTVRLTAGSGIFTEATSSATSGFNAATIICDGAGWLIGPASGAAFIGGSGRTMTINEDGRIGWLSRSLTVLSNVQLAGTGTRTLEVLGITTISGALTGTNGVNVDVGSGLDIALVLSGITSGLSGPCVVTTNRLVIGQASTANRYAPSSLSIGAGASFEYNQATQDFNFPVGPTGSGIVSISGNFSGTGVTFTPGTLSGFDGSVRAWTGSGAANNLVKLVIHEVTLGGLRWRCSASSGGTSATAQITYANASNVITVAPLNIDSAGNDLLLVLTGGTYSLIVPDTSGTFTSSGAVTRTNSIGTASARMNLTLGGLNEGNNTLSGDISEVGTNGAILGITKVGAGRWVLSGANSSHTGLHTISEGTLSAQSEKALGSATSAGGVSITGTGKLELSGGITLNKSSTPFTIHSSSPIVSIGDNTLQTAGITLGGTTTFEVTTGNRLALVNSGAITDSTFTHGLTKTGDGELSLAAFANTYDGVVTVSAGTLAFGSSGSLGTGNVQVAGNLKYTGTGETYSRSTQLTSATPSLEASGTGALTVSNLSQNTATKTLTLKGTNTDANKIVGNLADNTGTLSLAKEGTGKWVLPGVLSYTGTTTVSGGTLRVETTNSNTASGAVTIGESGTVELITDTLASSGATAGEVLGTGNVTVNGGTIKTRGGTTQKGQVRYGGNLTFGSGSTLYIGAAA